MDAGRPEQAPCSSTITFANAAGKRVWFCYPGLQMHMGRGISILWRGANISEVINVGRHQSRHSGHTLAASTVVSKAMPSVSIQTRTSSMTHDTTCQRPVDRRGDRAFPPGFLGDAGPRPRRSAAARIDPLHRRSALTDDFQLAVSGIMQRSRIRPSDTLQQAEPQETPAGEILQKRFFVRMQNRAVS